MLAMVDSGRTEYWLECVGGSLLKEHDFGGRDMPVAIRYSIRCEKDRSSVKTTYDLRVPVGGPALIASFSLAVDGKELIDQAHWVAGQVQFNGTQFTQLQHPENDVTVAFSISSNEGWTAANSDVLRGEKRFDEVVFSGS